MVNGLAVARRTVAQLAKDEGICSATVHRFIHTGIIGLDGARKRLFALRLGGRWTITDDDWAAFVAALNQRNGTPEATAPRDPSARDKAIDRADRELDRLGV